MEQRRLGQTREMVSVLGYGAGAVGGLLVRGEARDRERSVARAIELGINYFDTASSYGNGESERTLGPILKRLRAKVLVGTKVRITSAQRGDLHNAIIASLEASLRRLGRDSVELFQLHNPITAAGTDPAYSLRTIMEQAVPAMQDLRAQGKTRFIGITALGDTDAVKAALKTDVFDTAQCVYNALNPSTVSTLAPGMPGQDFAGLASEAHARGVGIIGIRALAGGALSGETARHPGAMAVVEPIGSGANYAADVATARKLLPMIAEGHVGSLVEAAMRFAISTDTLSTVLVGTADLAQLEIAAAAIAKGKLSDEALARMTALLSG